MMNTKFFSLATIISILAACSSAKPVKVIDNADVSKVVSTMQSTNENMHFSETNATGEVQKTANVMPSSESKVIYVPEKATAICNDGSFSMALPNEACLSNGGVKTIISKYHAE